MKKRILERIYSDIKSLKIQGATNVAKAALKAYSLDPTKKNKDKLRGLRPTEPMLVNVLRMADKWSKKKVLDHFSSSQEKINKLVCKLIKSGDVVYTHCHSTNVIKALIYSKKKGKKFEVYNTETRPMYQGRVTARELRKAGIKVTTFIDSAMGVALEGKQETRKTDLVLLGADAILKTGVMNKIGSGTISKIAKSNKIPLYVVADSWKYSAKPVPIEERDFHEIWKNAPKNVKVRNPAFEKIERKNIKAIVSEKGILSYGDFLKKAKKII